MRLPALFLLAVVLAAAGCTTVSESFPGSTPEQTWTALVAAAQTPDYMAEEDVTRRWHVQENEVVLFPEDARIEIFRRVQRVLHTERVRPHVEDRTWRFRVTLDSTDPPQATFISRGAAIPAHALEEADRYFDDVWNLLGGRPEPAADVPMEDDGSGQAMPSDEHEAQPAPSDDAPVDIDELLPEPTP